MKRSSGTAGFSVIEILLTISIFSLVAAGLLTTSLGATRGNMKSNHVSVASALIYDKVEQFRAIDGGANDPELEEGDHADENNPLTATGQPNGQFIRTWEVTRDVPRHGLSEVVIRVSWPGIGPTMVEGVTYVCNTNTCG